MLERVKRADDAVPDKRRPKWRLENLNVARNCDQIKINSSGPALFQTEGGKKAKRKWNRTCNKSNGSKKNTYCYDDCVRYWSGGQEYPGSLFTDFVNFLSQKTFENTCKVVLLPWLLHHSARTPSPSVAKQPLSAGVYKTLQLLIHEGQGCVHFVTVAAEPRLSFFFLLLLFPPPALFIFHIGGGLTRCL